jgi:penicillin V acylase-like amidase (Ntn superfamily)
MNKTIRASIAVLAAFLILWLIPGSYFNGKAIDPYNGTHPTESHCSSFCLKNNGYAVFGTNLDHNVVYEGMIYVNKRGVSKQVRFDWTAKWISKYASITFNAAAYQWAWSGMNEKGLVVSTMALHETVMPERDARPGLASSVWLQYVLDMCEDIDDVIAIDSEVRVVGGAEHYLISDRYGNCEVVEFLGGQMVVHRGEGLPVAALTNSLYTESVKQWQFKNQGHQWDRDDYSFSRFVKAADRVAAYTSRDFEAAVNYAFDTLYSVRAEQYFSNAASHWSIVYDARNMRIYFRTFYHPQIKYLDFWKMDMSCDTTVKMLDIQEELTGDVADDFINYSHEASYDFFLNFANKWGLDYSPSDIDRWLRSCEAFPCTEDEPADEVLVSKDISKINDKPRLAINTATEDALVVWQQLDSEDPSYARIRCAMLKRSLTGRYQLAESVLLSDNFGYNGRPFPVYLESKDLFLVVWDQADPNWPSDQGGIMGRIVSACGLPEGNVFTVLANGDRNESPEVYAKSTGEANQGKSVSDQKVKLVFSAVGSTGVPQLRVAPLNRKYRAGKPRLLVQGDVVKVNGLLIPEKILPVGVGQNAGDGLVIPIVAEKVLTDGTIRNQPKVVVIDNSNHLADIEDIGKPGDSKPCLAVLTNGDKVATVIVSVIRKKEVINSVMSIPIDGQAPLLTRLFEGTVYRNALDSQILPIEPNHSGSQAMNSKSETKIIGYQLYAATNGKVLRRAISEQGKPIGPFKSIFEHGNSLRMMCGAEITFSDNGDIEADGSADFVMIWQKRISDSLQEIRAQLFQAPR